MFYEFLFSYNTADPITLNHNKDFLYFNTHSTIFAWVADNSNKIECNNQIP